MEKKRKMTTVGRGVGEGAIEAVEIAQIIGIVEKERKLGKGHDESGYADAVERQMQRYEDIAKGISDEDLPEVEKLLIRAANVVSKVAGQRGLKKEKIRGGEEK